MSKKNYIGLSIVHDPAIAIVNDRGSVVFAEAIERYTQTKRAWGYPPDDIIRSKQLLEKYCHKNGDLVVAYEWNKSFIDEFRHEWLHDTTNVNSKQDPFAQFFMPAIAAMFNPDAGRSFVYQNWRVNPDLKHQIRTYPHHKTHAAAGYYTSPFKQGACAILDGFGENTSISYFLCEGGDIEELSDINFSPGSLGELYAMICDVCGFDPLKGEEWKVMGLAAYGKMNKEYYHLLKSLYQIDGCILNHSGSRLAVLEEIEQLTPKISSQFDKKSDFAYTGQLVFKELLFALLTNFYELYPQDNLILGGGCALNSAANGQLTTGTSFKNLHVFSAPSDDGNSIGAALLAYYEDNHPVYIPHWQSPYLGEEISDESLQYLRCFSHLSMTDINESELYEKIADLLNQGKIIAWVQGRAEFGPRALGNRSILADPRDKNVKDRLNKLVKFREEFRPFAPSILQEFGDEYFLDYQDSPYMERALHFRPEVIGKIPGVVHVDGTGRLQTVKEEWNKKYYRLIHAFYKITGIPILLNTSFNIMGKPIIHSVTDAVAVFLTSGIDYLVINNTLIAKPPQCVP